AQSRGRLSVYVGARATRRAAGQLRGRTYELASLAVRPRRRQRFFETQRIAFIGVVRRMAAELVVAGFAIARDGAMIFLVHFKSQRLPRARRCSLFASGQ